MDTKNWPEVRGLNSFEKELSNLEQEGKRRSISKDKSKLLSNLTDFYSNDYLGLGKKHLPLGLFENLPSGSTGSRLISGDYEELHTLEENLAHFFEGESTLVFSNTYQANLALLGALPSRHDKIVFDESCHASIKEGLRLSFAEKISYKHNDLTDLSSKLEASNAILESKGTGKLWVVTEALFSMEGDWAPLQDIDKLCENYHALLIIDEAHSTGIIGKNGAGWVSENKIKNSLKVMGFGKAFGAQGGCLVLPKHIKEYMINKARPFIYTTGVSPLLTRLLNHKLQEIKFADHERDELFQVIANYLSIVEGIDKSPIQRILVKGNKEVVAKAKLLQDSGFAVVGIRSPTVPIGKEQLRISLHSFNTKNEIENLMEVLNG